MPAFVNSLTCEHCRRKKVQKIIICDSLNDLKNVAHELLTLCKDDRIFAFYGEMGAGKTTMIKSICECIGVSDTVVSPTFTIVNEYREKGNCPVYHFDFYRIKNNREAFDLGFEEYLYSGNYCFIEWPEKVHDLLPNDIVHVLITTDNLKRVFTVRK